MCHPKNIVTWRTRPMILDSAMELLWDSCSREGPLPKWKRTGPAPSSERQNILKIAFSHSPSPPEPVLWQYPLRDSRRDSDKRAESQPSRSSLYPVGGLWSNLLSITTKIVAKKESDLWFSKGFVSIHAIFLREVEIYCVWRVWGLSQRNYGSTC